MRKFTSTEIDLCKKIAEKGELKKTALGDWYLDLWERLRLWGHATFDEEPVGRRKVDEILPLWQEHDCLKWLREKKYYYAIYDQVGGGIVVDIFQYRHVAKEFSGSSRVLKYQIHGETMIEALLRTVLTVMEE